MCNSALVDCTLRNPTTAVNTVENLQMHEYVLIHCATYIHCATRLYSTSVGIVRLAIIDLAILAHTICAPRCQRQAC